MGFNRIQQSVFVPKHLQISSPLAECTDFLQSPKAKGKTDLTYINSEKILLELDQMVLKYFLEPELDLSGTCNTPQHIPSNVLINMHECQYVSTWQSL